MKKIILFIGIVMILLVGCKEKDNPANDLKVEESFTNNALLEFKHLEEQESNITVYVWTCNMDWKCDDGYSWTENYTAEWDKKEYAPQESNLYGWGWGERNPMLYPVKDEYITETGICKDRYFIKAIYHNGSIKCEVPPNVFRSCWADFSNCHITENKTESHNEYYSVYT